jgi:metal-dependent amidase/aminoacylase/carboxypeptidase family protein
MKTKTRLAPMLCLLAAPALAAAQNLDAVVNGELSNLVETYKGIHEHPELSHHEEHTAALLAGELRKAGFAVTERVGKYPDGTEAYGLVAILQNGPGPRLLIRTDMDALPIVEETGVVYASHVRTKNAAGQDVGVCMPAGTMCT